MIKRQSGNRRFGRVGHEYRYTNMMIGYKYLNNTQLIDSKR